MLSIAIPDVGELRLAHLALDLNGTLTNRGVLIDGVAERLTLLAGALELHLVTADTFGRAAELSDVLRAPIHRIRDAADKEALVRQLGPDTVVAIENGRNDAPMLRAARLGIAIIGPEGAATAALSAADVACRSIVEALDLLLDERALGATLRP